MRLAALIIARNEEKNIKDCLKSLSFVDELIVIDNESEDKTAEIAKKYGATVYQVKGIDFSYLRNFAKEKANSEWLLYIDADERVTKNLGQEIKNFFIYDSKFPQKEVIGGCLIPRKNYYLGHLFPKKEKMIRLIKKDCLLGWQGSLHETAVVLGKIVEFSSPLLHFTHSNFASMLEKTNEWSEIEARLRYQNGHPKMTWWRFFRVMLMAFYNSYIKDGGWKVGTVGLIESLYQAFSIFITYAKLWELQNRSLLKSENFIERK